MKKQKQQPTLLLSVLRAIVGIALVAISIMLYDFRLSGGWSFMSGGTNFQIISGFLIVFCIEWILALLGLYTIILGGYGLAAKKMR